jgi:hypothetical protein
MVAQRWKATICMIRHTQHIWHTAPRLPLLVSVLLLATACATSSTTAVSSTPTATTPPLPTATPTSPPTCASAVPGAGGINLASQGFIYPIVFPQGTVGTAPQMAVSGVGLFTVYGFTACTPNTTTSGVQSFFSSNLGALQHGWIPVQTFPSNGGLMVSCGDMACWWNPKGGPLYYLIFDQYSDKGNGVITYRARWAVSPDFPTCGSNYTSQTAVRDVYFLPGYAPLVPLPPISSTVQDNAAGGVRGFDVCSPGTAQSVSAFMNKELSATGWTQVASNAACIYTAQCWTNGSAVISWNVGSDASNWIIAWRSPLP